MIAWGSVVTLSDTCCDISDDDAGVDPYYGIGLEFDLTRLMALRLQHERFSVDADSDVFVGGYEFDYQKYHCWYCLQVLGSISRPDKTGLHLQDAF